MCEIHVDSAVCDQIDIGVQDPTEMELSIPRRGLCSESIRNTHRRFFFKRSSSFQICDALFSFVFLIFPFVLPISSSHGLRAFLFGFVVFSCFFLCFLVCSPTGSSLIEALVAVFIHANMQADTSSRTSGLGCVLHCTTRETSAPSVLECDDTYMNVASGFFDDSTG